MALCWGCFGGGSIALYFFQATMTGAILAGDCERVYELLDKGTISNIITFVFVVRQQW